MEENIFEKSERKEKPWTIILILVVMIGIGLTIFWIRDASVTSQYAKQAISILKSFKNGQITADEAYTQIETLENRVEAERANNNDDTDLLFLSTTLSSISWELVKDQNTMSSESFTNSEIDEYIMKLRKMRF